ncbi:MAG TPA: hypothetical protein VMS56_14800 [Thermoanaerobaculia bacterium]|nr:hypothetical protein [Thermoanaerobaculia bacterium]
MVLTPKLRCRFDTPIEATLGGSQVHLVELGYDRACLEHEIALAPGKRSWLSFRAGGDVYRLAAEVIRCRVNRDQSLLDGRLHYRTELYFGEVPSDTAERLGRLLDVLSIQVLDEVPARHTEALQFQIIGA